MSLIEIIKDKKYYYHRISSLIILMIALMLSMISTIIPYLLGVISEDYWPFTKFFGLLIPELILIAHWYKYRTTYPRGKRKKQNIIVAIITENQSQKTRISNDFVINLKSQLRKYKLDNTYDVIVLHDALSRKLQRTIEEAFSSDSKPINQNLVSRFNNAFSKMNGRFIVYGNIALRNSPKNTYILNIEALIKHKNAPDIQKREIQQEFREIWEREISFLEEEEINGFKTTSEQVFFASTYMLGLATIIDSKYEKGIEINQKLLAYINENERYKAYETKVRRLLASSYYMHSRVLYFFGKIEESVKFRRKFHELTPDNYASYLNEAIYHVNKRNDVETALEFIEKAQKIAKGNGTWKYSKLYLLIKLNREKEALTVLDMIITSSFKTEIDTISQVITYNNRCLEDDSNHIQSNFIIGSLVYKKLNNPTYAYEKLVDFSEKSNNKRVLQLLKQRADKYINEINKLIGLDVS